MKKYLVNSASITLSRWFNLHNFSQKVYVMHNSLFTNFIQIVLNKFESFQKIQNRNDFKLVSSCGRYDLENYELCISVHI